MDILGPDDNRTADGQVLFEGAVLAILARILESGTRTDVAASEYLARFPIGSGDFHIRADMIICLSDCLRLLHHAAGDQGNARLVLDDATRAWRRSPHGDRLSVTGGATRIQACIGNIRRAIGAMP
jgi:hypothetical protein